MEPSEDLEKAESKHSQLNVFHKSGVTLSILEYHEAAQRSKPKEFTASHVGSPVQSDLISMSLKWNEICLVLTIADPLFPAPRSRGPLVHDLVLLYLATINPCLGLSQGFGHSLGIKHVQRYRGTDLRSKTICLFP